LFGDRPPQTGGQSDEAAAVLGEKVVVDSGPVVKALEITRGDQFDEVAISFRVFTQQHEMVGAALAGFDGGVRAAGCCVARRRFATIVPAPFRDVDFATDDGLDAARGSGAIKRFRGKEISMVGDGDGGHLAARRFVHNFFEIAGTVQKAVICVQMQVNESRGFHAGGYSNLARRFLLRHDLVGQASACRVSAAQPKTNATG